LFKAFVFLLEFLELFGELTVRASQVEVVILVLLLVHLKFTLHFTHKLFVATLSILELCLGAVVNGLALLEDFLVEVKFLLVEAVDSLHVLHALFKNLHFLFQFDLLVSLVVGIF
jgi:hypothetical protein